MSVYPAVHYYVDISGSWVDLAADVVSISKIRTGMSSGDLLDRVASIGTLKFILNSVDGYYIPGSPHQWTEWRNGLTVKMTIEYNALEVTKFYGRIKNIKPLDKIGVERVEVTVMDWMAEASDFPIITPTILFNQTIDQGMTALVDSMLIQPLERQFYAGQDTFSTVFDLARKKTAAISEIQRMVMSEFGYAYIRHAYSDEILVVESRHTRNQFFTLTQVTVDGGYLLQEDGDNLLTEASESLLLDATDDIVLDNVMRSIRITTGANLINHLELTAFPRRVDTVNQVLFSMASVLPIASGETKVIRGTFTDPYGGGTDVSGFMEAPVATTDYHMQSTPTGGSDLTAYLTVVAAYGAGDVVYTLTNTYGSTAYINKLQARGLAIFTYDSVQTVLDDSTSQLTYGYKSESIDQPYQNIADASLVLGQKILQREATPRKRVERVSFLGNYDHYRMLIAMFIDVGDAIYLRDEVNAIDGYYYIQGFELDIEPGILVKCSLIVQEALNLDERYWYLETVGSSELGSTTVLGY